MFLIVIAFLTAGALSCRDVDKKLVTVPEIREIGEYVADIKLHPDVTAQVRLNVYAKWALQLQNLSRCWTLVKPDFARWAHLQLPCPWDLAFRILVVLLLLSRFCLVQRFLLKVPGPVVDMEARSGLSWFWSTIHCTSYIRTLYIQISTIMSVDFMSWKIEFVVKHNWFEVWTQHYLLRLHRVAHYRLIDHQQAIWRNRFDIALRYPDWAATVRFF